MKKTLLLSILALLGMTQAMAQEYVPFVREGVKWVYFYSNIFSEDVLDMPSGIQYYSFDFQGDTLIGDKHYKPVILTHYNNGGGKEVEDFIPVYLREEDKVVYAIHPDGLMHPQCPVGIGSYVSYQGKPFTTSTEEFILYDFNDPIALYDSIFSNHPIVGPDYVTYTSTDMVTIGNRLSKCHYYQNDMDEIDKIIEGIGYDGNAGMPLFYFELLTTGFQVGYMLSHVIEGGEIIYKGIHYDPDIRVGIDEVVEDKVSRPQDPRYYDLMGRTLGTELPQTPGIYIHQGKKICISPMQ